MNRWFIGRRRVVCMREYRIYNLVRGQDHQLYCPGVTYGGGKNHGNV